MKNNKLFLSSLIINLLTFLLVVTGTIVMFTIGSGALQNKGFTVFKFFTFQSNLFMGAIAFIYAYYQFLIIKGKQDKIPHLLMVFNHVAVTAVALTFTIVVAFLAPGYGFLLMYTKANLFFHAIVPLLAMANYMFLEKECQISFKETLPSLIPSVLYGTVYFIIVVSLKAYGDPDIDFYMFGANGPLVGAFNFLAVVSIAYALGLLLYFVNLIVFKKRR